MRGTATTKFGFISANAWKMIFGLGVRVRKNIWHPTENSYRNSNANPYMMMVRAGSPVDQLMEQLFPYLSPGDILIDGGNSNYEDTNRRVVLTESKGFRFVGAGVSGGEEGALNGASIMPGGSESAWEEVKPVLQSIAAKAEDGSPCCQWVGPAGSGHFVKMIHNGIEYGDMTEFTRKARFTFIYFPVDNNPYAQSPTYIHEYDVFFAFYTSLHIFAVGHSPGIVVNSDGIANLLGQYIRQGSLFKIELTEAESRFRIYTTRNIHIDIEYFLDIHFGTFNEVLDK